MSSTEIVLELIDVFNQLKLSYMIVGSYSSNYWGTPRMTKDADFVIESFSGDFGTKLSAALPKGLCLEPQTTFETITFTTKLLIKHPTTTFKIELFLISDDEFDRARFARRVPVIFEGRRTYVPTPEDVVIQKLRWSLAPRREKDLIDVRSVLAIRHRTLDMEWIRKWCLRHSTLDRFEALLETVRQIDPLPPTS